MDATLVMQQRLTAAQRKAYERLRVGIRELVIEYDGLRQHTLADSIGASASWMSQVLHGRKTSVPTLERLARVLMVQISQSHRRTLRTLLEDSLRQLRRGPQS
jgi:transcriptional regulator with XRE-family HTH domain